MPEFVLIETEEFTQSFEKFTHVEKERVERFLIQMEEKGNLVGKPLGYFFLREKKFNGNRLYYIVYLDLKTILLVQIGGKKDQPETIQFIKKN